MGLNIEEPLPSTRAIVALRDALLGYLESLADSIDERVDSAETAEARALLGDPVSSKMPEDPSLPAAAADGGSAVYSLSSASLGVCVALSVQLRLGNRVRRGRALTAVVPRDPAQAVEMNPQEVEVILSPLREALVARAAEAAVRGELGEGPAIVILDGPLIPPESVGLAARIGRELRLAREAVDAYLDAHSSLLRAAREEGVTLVGFVKRPRSHYLSLISGRRGATLSDSAIASGVLTEVGQMAPRDPIELRETELDSIIGYPEIREALEPGSISFAFVRTSRRRPPFRVDFGNLGDPLSDPRMVAGYLVAAADSEGIPLPVVKADESVKVSRRVARDVYLESLRRLIARAARSEASTRRVIQLLTPMYGE